ncbi:hypothetical protein EMIT0324P_11258 [Pseudomonas chlororaphis]
MRQGPWPGIVVKQGAHGNPADPPGKPRKNIRTDAAAPGTNPFGCLPDHCPTADTLARQSE